MTFIYHQIDGKSSYSFLGFDYTLFLFFLFLIYSANLFSYSFAYYLATRSNNASRSLNYFIFASNYYYFEGASTFIESNIAWTLNGIDKVYYLTYYLFFFFFFCFFSGYYSSFDFLD